MQDAEISLPPKDLRWFECRSNCSFRNHADCAQVRDGSFNRGLCRVMCRAFVEFDYHSQVPNSFRARSLVCRPHKPLVIMKKCLSTSYGGSRAMSDRLVEAGLSASIYIVYRGRQSMALELFCFWFCNNASLSRCLPRFSLAEITP